MHLGYYLFKTKSYVYHTEIMRQEFYLFKTMYYVYQMIIVCDRYYLFKRTCYLYDKEIVLPLEDEPYVLSLRKYASRELLQAVPI